MTGRVIHEPPVKHSCAPGWRTNEQGHLVPPFGMRTPGVLWECDCGKVWVSWRCVRGGCLMVHWRRESWWARRRRLKNNSKVSG